ncbi:hypothetical protein BDDG_04063 [Blastomyces dermatitidis ATCC 18188]|uniref:Uncharacterized protein n=1 Tax=Ajellomyces dermatitidis (strain ATCC 18188 / CBS 674.68) TaxID=653446 RepID=F2TD11_AJEDA|nr:hypothetical protein BDDG_04063 [Blastomyces dermatitidis ATCC 18188]
MKPFFAFPSFVLALFPSFSSAGPDQNSNLDLFPFNLWAISPRGFTPEVRGTLQIAGDAVVVGPAKDGKDFIAYIQPLPNGEMRIKGDNDERFFLDPVSNHPISGYQTLKFGRSSTAQSSVSRDFSATNAGCGPHCGGPQVTPGISTGVQGNWFACPLDDGTNGKSGYSIHWVPGDSFPEGHSLIYLMRDTPPPQ